LLPGTNALIVFFIATVTLNLSPGPDMLYVISRSLGQGRKAGVISALGIGAGTLVHTCIAAFGLAAILLSIPIAFEVIRYAGAVYLIFLGIRMLLSRRLDSTESSPSTGDANLRMIFRQGVTTNVLNPKVALFFLAFLPQFVDPTKGAVALQIVLLGLIFDTSGTSWNIIVASIAGRASDLLRKRSGFHRLQKVLPGAILIALGVFVAFR
jgi:threonine/homoserine/homoserine lactone efflux protein